MNLHERVLSLLGCKYVNDVVIDAPYTITQEMVESLNIAQVVRGSKSDAMSLPGDEEARFGLVMQMGIYSVIPSPSSFNIRNIITRVQRNQESFQKRFERKNEVEKNLRLRRIAPCNSD